MTDSPTVLLYHCFAPTDWGLERGVRQLASILDNGLLLTPEELKIPPNPSAINREPPKTVFCQRRASLTLAWRSELARPRVTDGAGAESHFDLFGDFGIGLRPVQARRLGAVPVIYYYRNDWSSNVSFHLLYHLREIRSLLIAISRVEAKAELPDRQVVDELVLDKLGHSLQGDVVVRQRLEKLERRGARTIARLLDTDRVPAWCLIDAVDTVLDLFQVADDECSVDSHEYYQEREWRIVQLFGHVDCFRLGPDRLFDGASSLSESDCQKFRRTLASLNPEFFNDETLDHSAILAGADGSPFVHFVEEVICPATAGTEVGEVLRRRQLPFQRCDEGGNTGITVFRRSDS